ncbi:MAG TPA: hypothetical protein VKZ52_03350 [Burkholderiaceae bacterium]|nr:hypothetical protein [Burkholderiaceae bacterium]
MAAASAEAGSHDERRRRSLNEGIGSREFIEEKGETVREVISITNASKV